MQQIAHLLLGQSLFNQQAKDDTVTQLAEQLEELGASVRILDNVHQMRLIVAEHTGRTVIATWKFAGLKNIVILSVLIISS